MYTITFYSFKGGVGRTLALVNVAAELARMGRKVLLVDFDLEAPGLETFERLRPPQPHPGLVEYITEYMRSKRSPDVRDYIYSAGKVGEKGGELWVMPAGRRDANYQADLTRLDWKKLYEDCEGFLFFEDTKAQWEQEIKPDYVLIDSRTGHTDVKGICTRQLPDAVVVLFFPNEQNLVGLRTVCREIRLERHEGLKKTIGLHFVMSNVPDLDDEDKVLRRRLEAFHKELHVGKLAGVIHRYESVLLFNQAVFVLDKPRSRLAGEYRKLTKVLIRDNSADRDGVLAFLYDYSQRYLETAHDRVEEEHSLADRLDQMLRSSRITNMAPRFFHDPDVLAKVAECRMLEGSFGSAVDLFDRVISIKGNFAPALLHRALCKNRLGDVPAATADLLRYLQIPGISQLDVLRALRELGAISPSALREAIKLSSVQALDLRTKDHVAKILASTPEGLEHAIEYLSDLVCDHEMTEPGVDVLVYSLSDYLIQARRWHDASTLIEVATRSTSDWSLLLQLALDWMIASWGAVGTPNEGICRWWLAQADNENGLPVPEPLLDQVNALAAWRLGDTQRALREIDAAAEWTRRHGRDSFSWWRYRTTSPPDFLEDCERIRRMIQGEPIRPLLLIDPTEAK